MLNSILQLEKKGNDKYALIIILLIGSLFWGIAMSSGLQLNSWDGPTHVFFAKGYADNWWSIWDERWYGGFNKSSYPPLAHQIVGILIITTGQIELSYSVVLWIFLTAFSLAIYRFSKIFNTTTDSLLAALISIFLPSTRVMTFAFGQFAGFVSLTFALLSISAYSDFIKKDSKISALASIGWFGCAVASHTNTFFFLMPALFVFTGLYFLLSAQKGCANRIFFKSLKIIPFYILVSVFIILPFWLWLVDYKMQSPIMHPSRWDLLGLIGTGIFRLYFLDMYSYLLFIYIGLLIGLAKDRSYLVMFLCFFIYFLLGLGGTTNLPKFLFGKDWEWLTYERFSFWASIISVPIIAYGIRRFQKSLLGLLLSFLVLLIIIDAFIWLYNPETSQITRQRINLSPVYEVFELEPQCKDRFLSLGFDYQQPEFSTYTNAKTLDGLWHTARTDVFLRTSGMGSLDTALYWDNGEVLLKQFLARVDLLPANCIFLNETDFLNAPKYRSVLEEAGWQQAPIKGGLISFWTKKHKIQIRQVNLRPESIFWDIQAFLWGTLPIVILLVTVIIDISRYKDTSTSCE